MTAGRSEASILLRNLSVQIRDRTILRDISLRVASGEFVILLGPNGAGKSTLLRAMAKLQPASGPIEVAGRDLDSFSVGQRSRMISYLPQGGDVAWPVPVREVVSLGRLPHRSMNYRLSPIDEGTVARAMQRCEVSQLADRLATELSGGERKRVLLARLLAVEAPVMLADEPTSSLDPLHQIEILKVLREEAAAGRIVVAAVHEVGLALQFATRVLAIREGELLADGAPHELIESGLLDRLFDVRFGTARFPDGALIVAPRPEA